MMEVSDRNSNNIHVLKDISNITNNELNSITNPGQQSAINLLPNMDLPRISSFADEEREVSRKDYPKIVDLRKEDKTRISKLIDEIARYRTKNEEDSELINKLKTENSRLLSRVEALHNEVSSLKASEQNKFDEEYKRKISELTELKNEMESKNKCIDEKVNQMSREIRNLRIALEQSNAKRKSIEFKYKYAKNKLKQALNIIKRFQILKEYPSLHEKLYGKTPEDSSNRKSNIEEKARVKKSASNRGTHKVVADKIKQIETRCLSDLFFSNHPSTSEDEQIFVIHTESGI